MPHSEISARQRNRAKHLRRVMTRAETLLWHQLKAHQLGGLGFRRQVPMGHYIADFVAHSCRLVVELDGESHDFQSRIEHDRRRDAWFASRGYRVLRFTNRDVMQHLEGVVMAIGQATCGATPLPSPPPQGGGPRPSSELLPEADQMLLRFEHAADIDVSACACRK